MLPDKYDRIEVGRRIKQRRQAQTLTVDKLAKKAGVSAGYISEVERGMSAVSVDMLIKIAEGLGSSLDSLLGESDVTQQGLSGSTDSCSPFDGSRSVESFAPCHSHNFTRSTISDSAPFEI